MKLPDDPKERTQYLILGVIVLAAIGYTLVQFVILPGIARRKLAADRIVHIRAQLETAESKTRMLRTSRDTAIALASGVTTQTQNYVIVPALGGNFLLVAQELIEKHANTAGVELDSIRQLGESTLPNSPARSESNAFGAYTIQVVLQGSLDDLARFLMTVENSNPYLCVTGLTITPQPRTPNRHVFNLQVTWPRWVRDNIRRELLNHAGT